MLRRINETIQIPDISVRIGEASFPAPFDGTLEFNAPAHGVWNIVHTGMLIPDSHQIYICPANCMRGVVLTAAEMNAADRFSQVLIEEKDVLAGSIEQLTVDGVIDVIEKLPGRPRVVLVFTVCVHHFMGSDLDWIYRELGRRCPDVIFIRCFMDPIMRKSGLTPDQKMRSSLYEPIEEMPADPRTVCLLGSDFALDDDSDLKVYLKERGYRLLELAAAKNFEDYLLTGSAALYIASYPAALPGARTLTKRLGRTLLYLPQTFDRSEIVSNEAALAAALGEAPRNREETAEALARAERALEQAKAIVGDISIAIDYTFHPRPLGLSRLLLEHGFRVKRVYLDTVSGEEETDFFYLQEHCPSLRLYPTVHPAGRLAHGDAPQMLALGQKAAWFTGSRHFVNIVEGAGWYGFDGIEKLCAAMTDAYMNETDPAGSIPRKGLGCESCL